MSLRVNIQIRISGRYCKGRGKSKVFQESVAKTEQSQTSEEINMFQ